MIRVFVDASVLFAAAYSATGAPERSFDLFVDPNLRGFGIVIR